MHGRHVQQTCAYDLELNVSMTLTMMQGHSGFADEQIQRCIISTPNQAIIIIIIIIIIMKNCNSAVPMVIMAQSSRN